MAIEKERNRERERIRERKVDGVERDMKKQTAYHISVIYSSLNWIESE